MAESSAYCGTAVGCAPHEASMAAVTMADDCRAALAIVVRLVCTELPCACWIYSVNASRTRTISACLDPHPEKFGLSLVKREFSFSDEELTCCLVRAFWRKGRDVPSYPLVLKQELALGSDLGETKCGWRAGLISVESKLLQQSM